MVNKVILQGRLTKEPEMRYTTTGTAVVKATLAVDRSYVKQGEERKADFIRVTAFGRTAEFFGKYFNKGSMALIVGRIRTDSYDGDDGKKVYTTDVIIDEVSFCEKKSESSTVNTTSTADPLEAAADYLETVNDDDLPF